MTGETVKPAYVDQGHTGKDPAEAAREEGIELQVVKLPEAKKGFVLLPRRWVVVAQLRLARPFQASGP